MSLLIATVSLLVPGLALAMPCSTAQTESRPYSQGKFIAKVYNLGTPHYERVTLALSRNLCRPGEGLRLPPERAPGRRASWLYVLSLIFPPPPRPRQKQIGACTVLYAFCVREC